MATFGTVMVMIAVSYQLMVCTCFSASIFTPSHKRLFLESDIKQLFNILKIR